jgi:hypothetical protein
LSSYANENTFSERATASYVVLLTWGLVYVSFACIGLRFKQTEYRTEYPDSLISIAFGAPHVCDGKTAKIINDNNNFNWRFINFVNQTDPVPRLLHQLRSTAAEALRALGKRFFKKVDMTLKKVGGLVGDCNDDYPDDGIVGGLRVMIPAIVNGPNAGSTIAELTKVWHFLIDRVKHTTENDERDPYFSPIGRYVFLAQLDLPVVYCLDGSREGMAELLKSVQLGSEDLAYHSIRSYNAALIKAGLIEGTSVGNLQLNPSTNVVVTTPQPKVSESFPLPLVYATFSSPKKNHLEDFQNVLSSWSISCFD